MRKLHFPALTPQNSEALRLTVVQSTFWASMAIGGYLMYQKVGDVISSNWLGKSSTGVFFVVCAALVLFPAIPRPWATGLISFALALTLAALVSYIIQYRRVIQQRKNA